MQFLTEFPLSHSIKTNLSPFMSQLPHRAVNLLEIKLLCDCSYYLGDLNADCNKQLPSGQNKVNATHVNFAMKILPEQPSPHL